MPTGHVPSLHLQRRAGTVSFLGTYDRVRSKVSACADRRPLSRRRYSRRAPSGRKSLKSSSTRRDRAGQGLALFATFVDGHQCTLGHIEQFEDREGRLFRDGALENFVVDQDLDLPRRPVTLVDRCSSRGWSLTSAVTVTVDPPILSVAGPGP